LSGLKKSLHKGQNTGFESFDDCAIYNLDNNNIIIQSLDFFTPIVDDPFTFGQIAAANSLSDIYAMGGKPLFALNIAGFDPDILPISVLSDIFNGGQDIANAAKIPILGGHTVKDKEPKYGMAITGIVDKNHLAKNNNAKEGDVLILTKPLGIGIISTAIKNNQVDKKTYDQAVNTMITLNDGAKNAMNNFKINACTDITGYGLLGHLFEMCRGSNITAEISYNDIPFISNTESLAKEGIVPGGSKKNLNHIEKNVSFSKQLLDHQKLMLADAQTSGGLLISIPEKDALPLIEQLKNENCLSYNVIGHIQTKKDKSIYIK